MLQDNFAGVVGEKMVSGSMTVAAQNDHIGFEFMCLTENLLGRFALNEQWRGVNTN